MTVQLDSLYDNSKYAAEGLLNIIIMLGSYFCIYKQTQKGTKDIKAISCLFLSLL